MQYPSDGHLKQTYDDSGIKNNSLPPGFAYNSGTNPEFLTVNELRDLIRKHVDTQFLPK